MEQSDLGMADKLIIALMPQLLQSLCSDLTATLLLREQRQYLRIREAALLQDKAHFLRFLQTARSQIFPDELCHEEGIW